MISSINNLKVIQRIIAVLLFSLLLVGCSHYLPDQSMTSGIDAKADKSSAYYIDQMNSAFGSNKNNWWLLAVEALLREKDLGQAGNMLHAMPASLNFQQKQEYHLLFSKFYLLNGDVKSGQQELGQLIYNRLTLTQQQQFLRAKAGLYTDKPLVQLRAYIELEKLGDDSQREATIDATWQLLSRLSRQQLNSFVINADEYTLQGWLDLLRIQQDNKNDLEQFKNAVAEWQTRYATNPAAKYLPRNLFGEGYLPVPEVLSAKTALLLPLSGPSQALGQAIEAGFTAVAQSVDLQTATESGVKNLKVYDTNAMPMALVLNQVAQDGAKLIVGPLLKNNLDELQKLSPQIPVLALNHSTEAGLNHNVCYFALSPEDEAASAAELIHGQNKKQPLLLVPHTELGERMVSAFSATWNQYGGDGLYVQYLTNYQQLKESMNKGIGIKLSGSFIANPSAGGVTLEPQPIDAVYVVANQDELTLIKPMLDMISTRDKDNKLLNNQMAPPIYASSRSHSAGMGTDFRHEMDGVQFSEIPFLASQESDVVDDGLPKQFKNDYRLVRLYAMGMDAWHLAQNYSSLTSPDYHFHGKTGEIVIDNGCVIKLKPTWLKYQNGQIVPVAEKEG